MRYFLVLFLCSLDALASLDYLSIKNLNFQYTQPDGFGTVEKIALGFPFTDQINDEALSLRLVDQSFVVSSSMVDLNWRSPPAIMLNSQGLKVNQTSFNLGSGLDVFSSDSGEWTPKVGKVVSWKDINLDCQGESRDEDILLRLLSNCHNKMEVKIKKLDLPFDVFFSSLKEFLPAEELNDIPASNFELKSYNGNFGLVFYTRIIVNAGLRMRGHFTYENNFRILKVRIDKVRYGYFTITDLFFRELKKATQGIEGVKVEPPYVTIDLE